MTRRYVRRTALAFALAVCVLAAQASARESQAACTNAVALGTVKSFFAALDSRDPAAANALFAPKPRFQWYSTTKPGARLRAEARRRSTLLPYFRARVRARERMRIAHIRVLAGPTPDTASMNGYLLRRANDLRRTRFGFKTSVYCGADGHALIFVWSMARAATS